MAAWLYFLLFVAPVLTAKVKLDHLDQAAIQVVFGGLQNGGAPSFSASPFAVQPVTAAPNATLVDPDYWDSFDDYRPATTDYDAFDWMSTRRVASFSEGNLLLSPLGLKLALAILAEAATSTTQSELTSVLGFDNDRNVARRKFSSIISSMQSASPHYDLILGSRIYIDSSVEPRQRFSAISEQFYKTQLEKLDFGNPFLAAAQVNAWVSNVTKGRIPNLITEDEVKNNIVMVLTTLFFKGTWRHQFNPNATKLGTFYLTPTVQKQVSYMNVKTKFHFVESAKYDAKILRMPYLGSKFAMYIVVPNSVTGLQRVWESITDLKAEMLYLQERTVDVTLPRFKFDFTSVLDGVLMEMGIRQAFEDTASFPGLARGQLLHQRLRISKVLQRSGIEINELGSVAYSATEISLVNKFGEDEDTAGEVIANKPFMFFIEDETTRQLLFTGRVTDPLATTAYFKH